MIFIPDTIQGLIFDCDGTIADTMPLHFEAWQKAMQEYGVPFSERQFYDFAGVPTLKIIETLNQDFGYDMPVAQAAEKKEVYFEDVLHHVRPIQMVVDVIQKYQGKLPMAVATGGIRRLCEQTLKNLSLWDCFDAIVTAEDVKNGKPAPDAFLMAAQKLKAPPGVCCVFEDADLGVQAALAAGMFVIDVRSHLKT